MIAPSLLRGCAYAVLAKLLAARAQPGPASSVLHAEGWSIGVRLDEAHITPPADLTQTQSDAFAAATFEPTTVKALAARAGKRYGSHFRAAVAALVRRGLLVRTPEGVARPTLRPSAS